MEKGFDVISSFNFEYTGGGRIGTDRIGTRLIWLVGEPTQFKRLSQLNHHQFTSNKMREMLLESFVYEFPFREKLIAQDFISFVD